MGCQTNVYTYNVNDHFYLLRLSTRGGWVVKKVQNSVHVVIECPLTSISYFLFSDEEEDQKNIVCMFKLASTALKSRDADLNEAIEHLEQGRH